MLNLLNAGSGSNSFFGQCIDALKSHKAADKKDIFQCWGNSTTYGLTQQCTAIIENCGLQEQVLFLFSCAPQKQVKNTTKFLNCIAHNTVTKHDATHARILLALWLQDQEDNKGVSYNKLQRLAGNTRIGSDNDQFLREKINSIFKLNHGLNTVGSKKSNGFGDNGQFTILEITDGARKTHNRELFLRTDNKLFQLFISQIKKSTDKQLAELASATSEE